MAIDNKLPSLKNLPFRTTSGMRTPTSFMAVEPTDVLFSLTFDVAYIFFSLLIAE